MSGADDASLPRLRGRTIELLREAEARECAHPLTLEERPTTHPAFTTARERGAVTLACVLLDELRRAGGVCVADQDLEPVLRRLIGAMTHRERVAVEVEAYECLGWLGRALSPQIAADERAVPAQVDSQSPLREVLRWAIQYGRDLHLEYYDSERGELTRERVTPMSIEADVYLRGISHEARAEVVYELTHVGEVALVGGWARREIVHENPPAPPPRQAPARGEPGEQMNLIDEEE